MAEEAAVTPEPTKETMTDTLADTGKQLSLDDFIGQAIEKAEKGEPITAPEVKARSEDGKFKTAAAKEGDEAETDSEADKAEDGDKDKEGESVEARIIPAPQSMSAKDREAFYKLPPENQQWLAERAKQQEADYTRKTMETAEQKKAFDRLEQIIAPRRQQLAMNGMDDSTAIGQLFALSDYANADPVGFVRYLLGQRGIPISALAEPGQQQQADPQTLALQRELQGVKQFLQQQSTQVQEQSIKSVSTAIDEFAKDPAFPFYTDLEADMVPIVAALRQSNPGQSHKDYLAKAYKMALAANEEVSAKVETDRKAAQEAERIAKAKKEAAAAKKAQGTNVRSNGSLPSAAAKAKTVDEFIGALVDERSVA